MSPLRRARHWWDRTWVQVDLAGAGAIALIVAIALTFRPSDIGIDVLQQSDAETPTATEPPPPTPTVELAPAMLAVEPREVGNGETLLVTVTAPGVARAAVDVLGRSYSLIQDGGTFWTLVGVPVLTEPGPITLTLSTFDAAGTLVERLEEPLAVIPIERPVDILELTPEQAAVLTPESAALETAIRFEQFVVFDRQPHWSGPWQLPAEGFTSTQFGQGRSYDGGPVTGQHLGMDIANDFGTPILAPAAGRVAWVGEMPVRGNSVLIDHGAGVVSGYHHLQEATVSAGDRVQPGDHIASMGSTGLSTGPHLHWELSIYGVNVDPFTWTSNEFRP